jgi:mono/diheme cytochrome c family protein
VKREFNVLALLRCLVLLVFPAASPRGAAQSPAPLDPAPVDFTRDIQPIFAERCYSCHGPEKHKSGLRLDQQAEALAGGDSGKVIQRGRSRESLLYKYVAGMDPDKIMPPKGDRLTPNQLRLIQSWIDAGAPWAESAASAPASAKKHWSFQAPLRPAVPTVKNKRWLRNPIDNFVLARLEKEHITPSPEADRATLCRRLYLDLLGLPPTPEEAQSFLADSQSDAYERLVDSLLASPRFGERWGRHWLDLARYADTEGYQIDRPRPCAYLYRNWVIDAINRDLPFDEFSLEQIAGDLLPNATVEQKTAAGFHRNTMMNWEDGVDREEFRVKAKVDRVSTTSTVWLGLTLGCAQCHSHKYDPISQREFYQFYAFFNNADEVDVPAPQPHDKEAKAQSFLESTNAAKACIHIRGDFLRPGEPVQPGTLKVLHSFQPRTPQPDRLDLARWIIDPANPLTSRVAVNHLWLHVFGRGLVNTPEDWGARGELPSHPALLDWLAVEFKQRHWSRKQMIQLLVTSAAYRQSSHLRPELMERDPLNTLLARQNRFRLESEIVRDLHLAASGLLNDALGGPSFHPHMPDDLKALGGAGAFTWTDSEGPERYRRGLYIFAQRTVPYPVSMTFDQANPCETCARRERSDTPLQALTLLNHSLFVECARALGQRMQASSGGSVREKIDLGFQRCLSRKPSADELACLQQLYERERQLTQTPSPETVAHGNKPEPPEVADRAVWASVAQVILNLDEFVTRE